MSVASFVQVALQDLRFAVRVLARNPAFSLAVVLTLALGIGANAAVFTVVEAVLLRPPPYDHPDEIVVLQHRDRRTQITKEFLAIGDYYDLQAQASSFASMGSHGGGETSIVTEGEPIRVRNLSLAPGAFRALRPPVVVGRGIEDSDARPGAAPVVLLSHDLWVEQYGADRNVIGRSLKIGTTDRQVIGVVADGFTYPPRARTDVIVPIGDPNELPANRRGGWTTAIARLKPGQTIDQAEAELRRLSVQWERDYPQSNLDSEYFAVSLSDWLAGNSRTPLLLLFGAVGVLLLISCANVGNLVLARSLSRRSEMAVRVALGAGQGRLGGQLLAENLVLSITGGVFGVILAQVGARAITALVPPTVGAAGLDEVNVNGMVLLFSFAITTFTAVALGGVATLAAHRRSVRGSLVDATRMSMSQRARRSASALVAVEVAMAIVLLVGAGLILRSFRQLMNVDPGFRIEGVLTLDMQLPAGAYPAGPAREAFYQRAFAALKATPEIEEVGAAVITPLTGNNWTATLDRVDRPVPAGERPPEVGWQAASGGYFRAMGIRLVSGRLFDPAIDRPGGQSVVIASERIRDRYFDGEDPVGKQLRLGQGTAEIIGVVSDIRRAGLKDDPRADLYFPFELNPSNGITLFMKTRGDPINQLPVIRETLRGLEPRILLLDHATMESVASDSVRDTKLILWLLGLFAITAVVLAAVGIYGVTSYLVRQRTREIGARVALGATPALVMRTVLGDSLKVAAIGMAAGLVVSLVATRLIATMLFRVGTIDPLSIGLAAGVMMLVSVVSSYAPARRASRVDPLVALRSE